MAFTTDSSRKHTPPSSPRPSALDVDSPGSHHDRRPLNRSSRRRPRHRNPRPAGHLPRKRSPGEHQRPILVTVDMNFAVGTRTRRRRSRSEVAGRQRGLRNKYGAGRDPRAGACLDYRNLIPAKKQDAAQRHSGRARISEHDDPIPTCRNTLKRTRRRATNTFTTPSLTVDVDSFQHLSPSGGRVLED